METEWHFEHCILTGLDLMESNWFMPVCLEHWVVGRFVKPFVLPKVMFSWEVRVHGYFFSSVLAKSHKINKKIKNTKPFIHAKWTIFPVILLSGADILVIIIKWGKADILQLR